ncbi:MAG TPA: amidohydrolase family protein [Bryobacteraceae bacterium]|nr:amidohydrolase family protein [Bryobacteraceae bacterium]
MIDVNVNLSRWPFRRLIGDEPDSLVERLRQHGVTSAWAGTFDGILHKDLASANQRLVNDCRRYGKGLLVPFGSVNPKLPDWQEDLRRCHEDYKMPGVRLHPNYHGYELKDPVFAELLHLAAARKRIVQLAISMEDERTQHPLMRVPPVDISPLADLIRHEPELRLVVLNSNPLQKLELAVKLVQAGRVYFDISMVESVGGVARLLRKIPAERVLFGSHFPLFYFESAQLKIREAGLTEEETQAILVGNVRRLLES